MSERISNTHPLIELWVIFVVALTFTHLLAIYIIPCWDKVLQFYSPTAIIVGQSTRTRAVICWIPLVKDLHLALMKLHLGFSICFWPLHIPLASVQFYQYETSSWKSTYPLRIVYYFPLYILHLYLPPGILCYLFRQHLVQHSHLLCEIK